MKSTIQRYAFIDTLRALAILGVMAVHTAQWVQPDSAVFRRITENGARGVQLFFVASALTIFMSIKARSADEYAPVRDFFIRRFFRIAPLFYLGIIFWLLIEGFSPRYWAPNGIDGWTVFLTATFLHGFNPETMTSLVPGGWSIAVEMSFYLIAPLLFKHIQDLRGAVKFFLLALAVGVLFSGAVRSYWLAVYAPEQRYLASSYATLWFFAQLPIFALGIIAFFALPKFTFTARSPLWGYSLLILVLLLWLLLIALRTFSLLSQVLYGVSFVLLALALAVHPTRLLVNSYVRKLGQISFSCYMIHFVVLYAFEKVLFCDGFALGGDVGFTAAFCLVMVVSSTVSLVTYRYVERPGIAMGSLIIERIERSKGGQ